MRDYKSLFKESSILKKVMVGGGLLLVILLFIGLTILLKVPNKNTTQQKTALASSLTSSLEVTTSTSTSQSTEVMYVDVKGAVKHPGMYSVQSDSRLLDVIGQAGGFLPEADTVQINYAQKLTDQMMLYIPRQGEIIPEHIKNSFSSDESADSTSLATSLERINLNTADSQALQLLNGIGQKKAEEIIRYREEQGSFKNIDELKQVSGIGEKIFDRLKDQVTIALGSWLLSQYLIK